MEVNCVPVRNPNNSSQISTFYGQICEAAFEEDHPVVLGVHGLPGTHNDYTKLDKALAKKCRVVVPDFPGLGWTHRDDSFLQTTKSRSDFLANFLDAVKIDACDLMLTVSGGSHIGLQYANDHATSCKALIMIAPLPLEFLPRARPHSLIKLLNWVAHLTIFQPIRRIFYAVFTYVFTHLIMKWDDFGHSEEFSQAEIMDNVIEVEALIDFEPIRAGVMNLRDNSSMPIFIVYGQNDPICGGHLIYDLCKAIGIENEAHFRIYSKENHKEVIENIKRQWRTGMKRFGICFQNEGHFLSHNSTFILELCKICLDK